MCWPRMNCSSRFTCRGVSQSIGSTLRKVGTRRAMAIAKVALAATALVAAWRDQRDSPGRGESGAVSHAAVRKPRAALLGTARSRGEQIQLARQALLAEAQPIDDIRSTAEYRRRVGANLLEEFLLELRPEGSPQ